MVDDWNIRFDGKCWVATDPETGEDVLFTSREVLMDWIVREVLLRERIRRAIPRHPKPKPPEEDETGSGQEMNRSEEPQKQPKTAP